MTDELGTRASSSDAPDAVVAAQGAATGWQPAVIESIVSQTPTVKTFVLRPRHPITFRPGQHVDVRLTAPDGYEARRSYSITSAPANASPAGSATVELAVERLRNGEVSEFFHDVAVAGDEIEVSGPFTEHFVWRPEADGTVLLVGGGSGVAPFMSMVRHRATLTRAPAMTLVYSARSWSDVIFREELLQHESAQRGLRVLFCITRESTADAPRDAGTRVSAGVGHRQAEYTRRIDAAIMADVLASMPEPPSLCFVCGNNGFVGTVADALVALGVRPGLVRTERYGE